MQKDRNQQNFEIKLDDKHTVAARQKRQVELARLEAEAYANQVDSRVHVKKERVELIKLSEARLNRKKQQNEKEAIFEKKRLLDELEKLRGY